MGLKTTSVLHVIKNLAFAVCVVAACGMFILSVGEVLNFESEGSRSLWTPVLGGFSTAVLAMAAYFFYSL